jgi:hypothetical protein
MHERRNFEWDGFVIPLVSITRSPARLLRELSNGVRLSRMGLFRGGRFERATTSPADSSGGIPCPPPCYDLSCRGGVRGDEVCGKVGRESRRDMESYDTVNGSKIFPHGACLRGYSITTSSTRDARRLWTSVWDCYWDSKATAMAGTDK